MNTFSKSRVPLLPLVSVLLLLTASCLRQDTGEPVVDSVASPDAASTSDVLDARCCPLPPRLPACIGEVPPASRDGQPDFSVGGRRRTSAELAAIGEPSEENGWTLFDEEGCHYSWVNRADPNDYDLRDDDGCPYWHYDWSTGDTCGIRVPRDAGSDAQSDAGARPMDSSATPDNAEGKE